MVSDGIGRWKVRSAQLESSLLSKTERWIYLFGMFLYSFWRTNPQIIIFLNFEASSDASKYSLNFIILLEIFSPYNYYMNDKSLTTFELDNLINRLINEKKGNDVKMSEQEIKSVCVSAR